MFWTPQVDDDAIMVALDEAEVLLQALRDDDDENSRCPDCGGTLADHDPTENVYPGVPDCDSDWLTAALDGYYGRRWP